MPTRAHWAGHEDALVSHHDLRLGGLLRLGGRRASLPRRRRGRGHSRRRRRLLPVEPWSYSRAPSWPRLRGRAPTWRPSTGPPSPWRPPGSARAPNAAPPRAGPGRRRRLEVKASRCRRRARSRPRGPGEGQALGRGGQERWPTRQVAPALRQGPPPNLRGLHWPPARSPQSHRTPTASACSAGLRGGRSRAPNSCIVRWAAPSDGRGAGRPGRGSGSGARAERRAGAVGVLVPMTDLLLGAGEFLPWPPGCGAAGGR